MEFSCLFLGILLLCSITTRESAIVSASGNETDRLALLDFKNQITQDPFRITYSWNDSLHFCNWVGITCNPSNGRLAILNLESQKLVGSLPPSIGNLTFLTGINLNDNAFHGGIPQEIGRLQRLKHLNLSFNSFGGKIPTNLSRCTELTIFQAMKNELVGQIPEQLTSRSNLIILALDVNYLSGIIPTSIGNLSSLYRLSFMQNNLRGIIPPQVGLLSNLGFFQVNENELSGTVPSSIYNISSLYFFTVAQNNLQGELPPDVGLSLPNLQVFAGGVNNFTGSIPVSLPNASQLWLLDFAENSLTGTVPTNLGILQSLIRINFDDNKLGNGEMGGLDFVSYLVNCTSLEVLGLRGNMFGGELPNSIANLSANLHILTLGSNMFHGSVPNGVGNLVNLISLGLEGNNLNGSVPEGVGKLKQLGRLHLNYNRFSGPIPSSLGNLTSLTKLFMEENRLQGSIPPSLGNCSDLLVLNLSSNDLSGTIPKEFLLGLSSISISLAMAHNSLTGSLPIEVGNLKNLREFDVSDNKLSGEIPSTFSSCLSLERLILEGNSLQGTIPESLKDLRGVEVMDFSHNILTGKIPEFLGKLLLLKKLDLSFNHLEGKVPSEGIFANASEISIRGNNRLCGGVPDLNLPSCSQENTHSSRNFPAPKVVIILVTTALISSLLLCFLATCYVIKKRTNRPLTESSTEDWQLGISYAELVKATNGFSDDNLIGSGSFGSVFKGVLSRDGAVVAVKVLNLQQQGAGKSFVDECKALKSVRHRNILKIISACSSIDQQGNDFKALVFEFMPNGSLDQWLHPRDDEQHQTKRLNILQRINIAIDVASALEYLHHHCHIPIVHCDLKPSNVLLDDDISHMTAHVGDFGLANFLSNTSKDISNTQNLSIGLKGSIGYIAPENGMGGQVSTLGDVYSYGILLLEMFTSKRPTDEIFKDGLSIHNFVAMALPDRVIDVVDRSLLLEEDKEIDNENEDANKAKISDEDPGMGSTSEVVDCLVSVLRIGLSCSDSVPGLRMPMNTVVNKMQAVRKSFLSFKKKKYGYLFKNLR